MENNNDNRQKSNAINTDYLIIRDNIMEWGNTLIQLSNVSSISTETFIENVPFPVLSITLIIAGFLCFNISVLAGIVAVAAGVIWIYFWWNKKNNPGKTMTLNIMMNSGAVYGFLFNSEEFKLRVLRVLEIIIAESKNPQISVGDISIDIKNDKIIGDVSFLNGRLFK